jgi:hypothetical protein
MRKGILPHTLAQVISYRSCDMWAKLRWKVRSTWKEKEK